MSFIGRIGAERLDASNSSLGLIENYNRAVIMFRDRVGMLAIKKQTGWETGADGKWRYEIDDPFHNTAEIEEHIKRNFGEAINIHHFMRDNMLLTAYPAFERLLLYAMYSPTKSFAGYFDSSRYAMMVCMGTPNSRFDYQTEGVLLHEVQHLIQEEENFARGGSGNFNYYRRLGGEVEARNICIRHKLSKEERRSTLRSETQDVPDKEQIIKMDK